MHNQAAFGHGAGLAQSALATWRDKAVHPRGERPGLWLQIGAAEVCIGDKLLLIEAIEVYTWDKLFLIGAVEVYIGDKLFPSGANEVCIGVSRFCIGADEDYGGAPMPAEDVSGLAN